MIVVCAVVALMQCGLDYLNLKGTVLSQNETKYVVDFSIEAKTRKYKQDYSHTIVLKEDCVELK